MRHLHAITCAFIAMGLAGPAAADCLSEEMEPAHIAAVVDARTLALSDGRLVRPSGIDSFALLGADAQRADGLLADRLAALVAGRRAQLQVLSGRPDRYGRLAALVAIEGKLVQAQLAAAGAALALPHGNLPPCMPDILAAEAVARSKKAGLWADVAVLPARPGALSPHLGGYVIFEGEVLSVGNRTRRSYLNFGRRWSEDVTVVIEARDRDLFGGADALAALSGLHVRIRGFLEERGGPLVIARWKGQIEVVEPLQGEGNGS